MEGHALHSSALIHGATTGSFQVKDDKCRIGNRILYRVKSETQTVVAGTQHRHRESEGRPKSKTKAGDVAYNALGCGAGHPMQLQEVHRLSDASPFLPGSLDLECSRTPNARNLHQ
jgi:hypothetical protein